MYHLASFRPPRKKQKEKIYLCPEMNCQSGRLGVKDQYWGTRQAIKKHVLKSHCDKWNEDRVRSLKASKYLIEMGDSGIHQQTEDMSQLFQSNRDRY